MERSTTRDRRRPVRPPGATRRADAGSGTTPPVSERGLVALDDCVLARLQAVTDYPCASVLMTTAPAGSMSSRDAARLERLVAAAARRLDAEAPYHTTEPVLARLRRLLDEVRGTRTGLAVALFASNDHDAATVLPIAVTERVVVDPTFATRDLVRALAARPRVRVVVASDHEVRVLEGWSGQLEQVASDRLVPPAAPGRGDRGRGFGRELRNDRRVRSRARARRAAAAVAARHAAAPLPLVVAGVARQRAAWRSVPAVADAVIGTIAGNHEGTPVARLDELSRPAVQTHLREQRREVLAELAEADPDRCAFGVDRVWAAARTGRVTVLCVEDGFTYPARPVRDGRGLEVADPLDGRDVLDDAVDEIIELVRLDGGRVVTVRDGALAGCGSIGALLRTH
jgi:hypothetical protein